MDTLREMEVVRRSGTGLVALTLWACAAPMPLRRRLCRARR